MTALGPLPVSPGTVKVRYLMNWNSRPAVNVQYMSYSGSPPLLGDVNSVATALLSAWNTNIRTLIASTVTLSQIEVTDLATRTGAVSNVATTSVGTGAATNPAPNSIALVISWKTNYRFRGGHARIYLPGQRISDITNGTTWSGTYVTSATSAASAWLTAMQAITVGGSSYKPVMLSYFTHDASGNQIYHPGGPQKYDIISAVVHTRVDTQRRRLGKELS